MKNTIISIAIACAVAFTGCNNDNHDAHTKSADSAKGKGEITAVAYTPPAGVSPELSGSIKGIVDGYLRVKDELTNDNGSGAAEASKQITAALAKVDQAAMTDEQKKVYTSVADDIAMHADHIGHNAAKIAHQREHFETLSKDVEDLVKTFGGGQKLYKEFCPMAFDNKGASWLSLSEKIRNPYFGDEMLECGEVKESL